MSNTSSAVMESVLDTKQTFSAANFALDRRITKAIARLRFVHVTLVQAHCIPLALEGKDLLVRARTGSGKTAAFGIPLIQKILNHHEEHGVSSCIKALILVPTKELVEQTKQHLTELIYYCKDIISILSLGGESMNVQQALLRDIPDILISTPGRLLNHIKAQNVNLKDSVHTLVLDEADMMLSFGYKEDIRSIVAQIPKTCQSFFMSATLSPELDSLKRAVLHNPAIVKLEEGATDGHLQQFYVSIKAKDKDLLLYALIKLGIIQGKVLFFVNSTSKAYRLKLFFEQFCIQSAVLNAQLPHNSRQHIIQEFNSGVFDFLIATDESMDYDEDDEDEGNTDEESEEQEAENEDENENHSDIDKMESDDENESNEDDNEDVNVESNEDDDEDDDDDDEEEDDDDEKEEMEEDPKTEKTESISMKKKKKISYQKDKSYGVSRGVDFRGVTFVVNVDFPKSVRSYTHRIGRTARGGANGTALSLLASDDSNEWNKLEKIQKYQQITSSSSDSHLETNLNEDLVRQPAPLAFDIKEIDCFRYRVEDVRRAVTGVGVIEAQRNDFKKELLNSQKLQAHFEDNPRDLNTLQHDKVVGKAIIQPHLANIPSYLVPEALLPSEQKKRKKNRRRGNNGNKKRRTENDPLHTFEYNNSGTSDHESDEDNEDETNESDRIFTGKGDTGKSTSGRQRWKAKHRKGDYGSKAAAYKRRRDKQRFKK